MNAKKRSYKPPQYASYQISKQVRFLFPLNVSPDSLLELSIRQMCLTLRVRSGSLKGNITAPPIMSSTPAMCSFLSYMYRIIQKTGIMRSQIRKVISLLLYMTYQDSWSVRLSILVNACISILPDSWSVSYRQERNGNIHIGCYRSYLVLLFDRSAAIK